MKAEGKDLFRTKRFRVMPILRLSKLTDEGKVEFDERPIREGLSVERRLFSHQGKLFWLVTTFVRLDQNGDVRFEEVGSRLLEYVDEKNIGEYKACCIVASNILMEDFRKHGI